MDSSAAGPKYSASCFRNASALEQSRTSVPG